MIPYFHTKLSDTKTNKLFPILFLFFISLSRREMGLVWSGGREFRGAAIRMPHGRRFTTQRITWTGSTKHNVLSSSHVCFSGGTFSQQKCSENPSGGVKVSFISQENPAYVPISMCRRVRTVVPFCPLLAYIYQALCSSWILRSAHF